MSRAQFIVLNPTTLHRISSHFSRRLESFLFALILDGHALNDSINASLFRARGKKRTVLVEFLKLPSKLRRVRLIYKIATEY